YHLLPLFLLYIRQYLLKTEFLVNFFSSFYTVTFHTHAKVVGIMRQNAKSFRFFTLAFCVHQL
ncbi:hypothetical protein, partial [Bacteroides caecimuris]|uniref:hypothetical protein n=1 Tax=Bacteroides caecimuris TaxID=1796613 RepID=UPI00265CEEDD